MQFLVWGSKGSSVGLDLLAALVGSLGHKVGYRNPQLFTPAELERPAGVIVLEADASFARPPITGPEEAMGSVIVRAYRKAEVPLAVLGCEAGASTDLRQLLEAVGPALEAIRTDPRLELLVAGAPASGAGASSASSPPAGGQGVSEEDLAAAKSGKAAKVATKAAS